MTQLELKLLPKQQEILNFPSRFKVCSCGRRFGKSQMSSYKLIIEGLQKPWGVYWIVSPTYPQTKIIWRMLKRYLPKEAIKRIMEGELYIELNNNTTIWAKSGDTPDNLRGEGLDGVVLDECAMLKEEVWAEVIRPALSDKNGWAIFISTPKGKNWFYELFLRGKDEGQKEYQSFQYPSHANPLLKRSEIEEMALSMPEITYRQEILAEFVDAGGLVFRGLEKVLTSKPEEPKQGEYYVIGVDLGRHEDFTVIKVGKLSERREVYTERFNRADWDYIRERIREVHRKYNKGTIIIDSTGYGDPIYEELGKEGLNIYGININVSTKPMLIENLQLMIENQQISLLDDQVTKNEFGAFTYTLLPSGHVRYEAPKGFHDDCVTGVALMAYGMQGGGGSAVGMMEPDEDREEKVDFDDMKDTIDWNELEEYEIDITKKKKQFTPPIKISDD